MLITSLKQSFITNPFVISTHKPKPRITNPFFIVSCKYPLNDPQRSRKVENEVAKLVIVTLAAGVLTFTSMGDAFAAKSGGRVGGQAFRSSAPRPSAPRASSPRPNSRTNIYINPPVAPPLGGYGYGYGYGGGWGWSPFSFFAPGPGVAVATGGGFDPFVLFIVLGAVAAVVRNFGRSRGRDDDDDY